MTNQFVPILTIFADDIVVHFYVLNDWLMVLWQHDTYWDNVITCQLHTGDPKVDLPIGMIVKLLGVSNLIKYLLGTNTTTLIL